MTNIAKNAKNDKSNKNQDFNRNKRSQEEPRNVRKYRKSNKNFLCQLKTPMTNIAIIAKKKTNVTKFQTQKEKKPRRTAKCPQISQKSQK